MIAIFAGKRVNVATLEEASRVYCAAWDRAAQKGRIIRGGEIYNAGGLVARISQNGRIWSPEPWTVDAKPLYEAQR